MTIARSDTITVCAIVKDERPYLVEWVAYYRLLGFDRLLLYSNDCSDGTDALLDAMQAAGLLEHRRWPSKPGVSAQRSAYADAIARAATRWMLFADADEFLHLVEDQTVHAFLGRFPDDVGAIAVNWRLFGSNGQAERGAAPVIERFTRAARADDPLNHHVKTIAVAAAVAAADVHAVTLARGRYVGAAGHPVTLRRGAFKSPAHRIAQINHYVVKSRAEFADKQRRGDANLPPEAPNKLTTRDGAFFAYHDRNDEEETGILVRLDPLKAEMARVERLIGA
jgi:hypothetical protein